MPWRSWRWSMARGVFIDMDTDPLAQYPGYLLRRISVDSMAELTRRLRTLRLRPAEASVLLIVEANRNITQVRLARMIDIAAPNLVPLIARLAERGLIERFAVDGRSHGLHLTAPGAAQAQSARKIFVKHEQALMSRLPARQREPFMAALRALWLKN